MRFKSSPKFHFVKINTEILMAPCESTAKEISFEWSHHRISSTNSTVRTTSNVSITDCVFFKVNN